MDLLPFPVVDCGPLHDIGNGTVTHQSTLYQAQAVYECNAGFRLNGTHERTCTQTGDWSGTEPHCSKSVKTSHDNNRRVIIALSLIH